ncbi:Pre-mRNA cleavage factor Im 25 kDa subunit 2 [Picochlorum sp. SENEW3]|nr:Pre-mRNA cleavage factor Im 25 kDa subunit 2 [Picochlorum sp. SENEW3]
MASALRHPGQSEIVIYPINNYSFGSKEAKKDRDNSVASRLERLKDKYGKEGVRHSVDAVVLVYEHGHPHVLLFQVGTSYFKLPGGRLRPGEGDVEGLIRKLDTNLGPEAAHLKTDWKIGECVGTYYRPNFENIMYPYVPPHIERPKEIRNLYMVPLPEKCYFSVPKNYKLIAVPLFEIYDHIQRYGPVIASLPQMLSRFRFNLSISGGMEGMDMEEVKEEEVKKEEEAA